MEEFMLLFALFVVLALIGAALIWGLRVVARQNRLFDERHRQYEVYSSQIDRAVIGISFAEHKIVLGTKSAPRRHDFTQITSVEIIENEATITKTNRGSQLLGAAVGGILTGGVGVVVGGLSGSSRSRSKVQRLALKVIVDDERAPVHTVCFFRSPSEKGSDETDSRVRTARREIEKFHAHLVNVMRSVQVERQIVAASMEAQIVATSLTDELERLWQLKQKGALEESEFRVQKQRLLAQNDRAAPGSDCSTSASAAPGEA